MANPAWLFRFAGNSHLGKAAWTLVDQAVVSLGGFLANVLLARYLSPQDYGTFVLVYGAFLGLQVFNLSLLFYPISIRLQHPEHVDDGALANAMLVLCAFSCGGLGLILSAGLAYFGLFDLLLPALAALVFWQMNEAMRRVLLARFRPRAALLGDAISYLGQVASLSVIAASQLLTLETAFYSYMLLFAAGAIVQAVQLKLSWSGRPALMTTMASFWQIGRWSLANNLTSLARDQIFPFALAIASGPVAAGSFRAAFNIISLANPIIIGLCNIIPQSVAQVLVRQGRREAWRTGRLYLLIGAPAIVGYFALVFAAPGAALGVFYGWNSPYGQLIDEVRVLVIFGATAYAIDIFCAYLMGVNLARLALLINAIGVGFIIATLPLTLGYGLLGACLALVGANVTGLIACYLIKNAATKEE